LKTQCLIVDDEPLARDLLACYIEKVNELEVADQCSNALEAFAFLQKKTIDLLFLDIQMPKMNGLELIKSLHQKPKIIITTAFREYAVDGFELDVLDYLVKPVSFDRFLKSIAKYNHYSSFQKGSESAADIDTFESAYMYVKVNKDMIKVFLKDIVYIESIKDYLKIVLENGSHITYQRISYMEENLPEERFLRVHKSYIAALDKISSYRNDTIYIGSFNIPIGRIYKQNFLRRLVAGTGNKYQEKKL
jgi:DNA-binding LytR/AlgR family response regulator